MEKILVISEIKNGSIPKEISIAVAKLENQFQIDYYLIGNIESAIDLIGTNINQVVFTENSLNFNLSFNNEITGYQYIISNSSLIIDELTTSISIKNNIPIFGKIINFEIESNRIKSFKQSIFSGKATQTSSPTLNSFILSISKLFEGELGSQTHQTISKNEIGKMEISSSSNEKLLNTNLIGDGINLEDAAIVVGAGRGMKAKENWGIIEELARKLGAATACSKPVSDLDWRPHHEHVGQTGVKIAPNLYIACGISGAVQHLAGVNGSKTIVVINNDPDAPFAKNADYIIQGDLFKVIPELLNKLN